MALGTRRPARRPAQDRLKKNNGAETTQPVSEAIDDDVVDILRLSHDGRGVAKCSDGKTVFVDQGLPGERVQIKTHRQRSKYDEAHIVSWLEKSPERVEPQCQHFSQCGGCSLQHLSIEAQRKHKLAVLGEHLARENVKPQSVSTLYDADYGYRRRARLGIKVANDGQIHFGFRFANSDRLLSISECPVLVPSLQALIVPIRQCLESLDSPRYVGHIEMIAVDTPHIDEAGTDSLKDDCSVTLIIRQIKPCSTDEKRWNALAEEQEISVIFDHGEDSVQDEMFYRVKTPARTLDIGFKPGNFIQVNARVNQSLIGTVTEWFDDQPNSRIVDLFSGVGNFSLPLAERGHQVHAIEGSQSMVDQLEENADRLALNVTAQAQDLNVAPSFEEVDAVLLDPPRNGALSVAKALSSQGPRQIVYVSCDPATLARDAAMLVEGGYTLANIKLVDMFPHTAHMESVSLFVR